MNMCIYHAIAKSNTLQLDNKETPIIVLLSFASFSYISLLLILLYWMQLNSIIII